MSSVEEEYMTIFDWIIIKLAGQKGHCKCFSIIQYNCLPSQPASKAKDFIVMIERLTSVVARIHEGIMKANSINDPNRFASLSLMTSTQNICEYIYALCGTHTIDLFWDREHVSFHVSAGSQISNSLSLITYIIFPPDIHVMMVEMNQFKGAMLPNVTSSSNISRDDEDTIYYPESLFSTAIKDKAKEGMALTFYSV